MVRGPRSLICLLLVAAWGTAAGHAVPPRTLPPPGVELPPAVHQQLAQQLREVVRQAQPFLDHPQIADVGMGIKAVDLALRHGEFYAPKDAAKAERILKLAAERIGHLAAQQTPWTTERGRVVRGFRSQIDGSFQPYGLVIPADLPVDRPVPLYVWLHGRGDKQTDLHFLHERLDQNGQIQPPGAIVLHPFGRHCVGFKSAGEIDVLEAIEHVKSQYPIDPERIVLMGFSMGGAGAWHLGAHYTTRFVAISAGAGFVETARYTNLAREQYPPLYEQQLWGVYDVPNYVRNLFNRPVIAYSGELDKQIQAARVMEEAYRQHGKELVHLIGPGMGHKYHPETLKEILQRLAEVVEQGRPERPTRVTLQTQTLRYHRIDWVEALGLQRHWHDSRIDAEITGDRQLDVSTKNVTRCRLGPFPQMGGVQIRIDGQSLTVPPDAGSSVTLQRGEPWQIVADGEDAPGPHKRPGLQGPIDDAFLEPFLVVLPSQQPGSELLRSWLDEEIATFRDRWRAVFRGEPRVKRDEEVSADDIQRFHLVVWGTPATNQVLKRVMDQGPVRVPWQWSEQEIVFAGQGYSATQHVPVCIYPNPLNPQRYVVINSGPTFRSAHDRTNSLQNPKLPDWAVLDITQPPDGSAAGRVVAADFFNEQWQWKE